MVNIRRILMIGLAIVLAPMALCYVAIYIIFTVPENNIRQSLNLYPQATAVLEESGLFSADIDQRSLYYWTASPIEDVQKFYEESFVAFIETADPYGSWRMTAYHLDGSYPIPDTQSSFLGHGSFCNYRDDACVSIALADASQSDLYRLAISSPSMFYRITPPPELANIPAKGTLIIYSYWVHGF